MHASVLDLRYKMKDILKALRRNEIVKIFYRGRETGVIVPSLGKKGQSVKKHPFFGMNRSKDQTVDDVLNELRGGRYKP